MSRRCKYPIELLEKAVLASNSIAGVLRYLNLKQAGGTQAHLARKIKDYGIDTSHFVGQAHNKGKTFFVKRKSLSEILTKLPEGSLRPKRQHLKRSLIESGVDEKCAECGLGMEWNGKPLVLHIDHKDGDWLNNTIENIRFLCPNCHTQTATYGVTSKPSYSNW